MTEPSAKRRVATLLRDWLPTLLLLGLILVARSTLADHYHVPTGSMEHALVPGDHVMVNKAAYGLRVPFTKRVVALASSPQRGEVVVFDSPEDGTRLIKRIVAIGGDRVTVNAGRVLGNGQPLASGPETEPYGDRQVRLNLAHGGDYTRVPGGQQGGCCPPRTLAIAQ